MCGRPRAFRRRNYHTWAPPNHWAKPENCSKLGGSAERFRTSDGAAVPAFQTIKTNVAREGLGITDSCGPDNRFHQLAGPTDYVLLVDSLLSPTKLVNAS